jgi:hypothetical protein
MFGDLPPSSSVTGMMFCDALAGRQRLAGFKTEAVDDIQHARRQEVGDQLDENHNGCRRLLRWLQYHAIAGGKCRCELPDCHQNGEVPRNDLADNAERLMKMIGISLVVDRCNRAFLRTDASGEITKMINRQRYVRCHRFTDRLAVVDRFRRCKHLQVCFHAVSNAVQNVCTLCWRGLAPGFFGDMRCIQS